MIDSVESVPRVSVGEMVKLCPGTSILREE